MRRDKAPSTGIARTIQMAQHGADDLDRGAEGAPHHVPDPLVPELVPESRDQLGAVVDCFLCLVEDAPEELDVGGCVCVQEAGERVVVDGQVEDGAVDLFQADVVAASEEDF